MLTLEPTGNIAKLFIWCCDNLPFTVTRDYSENKIHGVHHTGIYYIERGTTLCHVFWAVLWVPLIIGAGSSGAITLFIMLHVTAYHDKDNKWGIAGAFMPEFIMLIVAIGMGIVTLAIIGGDKVGFWKFVWTYLRGIKERVCPLVQFAKPNQGT